MGPTGAICGPCVASRPFSQSRSVVSVCASSWAQRRRIVLGAEGGDGPITAGDERSVFSPHRRVADENSKKEQVWRPAQRGSAGGLDPQRERHHGAGAFFGTGPALIAQQRQHLVCAHAAT